jgi:hypothetical protein
LEVGAVAVSCGGVEVVILADQVLELHISEGQTKGEIPSRGMLDWVSEGWWDGTSGIENGHQLTCF